MVEKMFLHLEGNKIDNYECPVPECKMRNFCVNKFDEKKCIKLFKANFQRDYVNLKFIEPFLILEVRPIMRLFIQVFGLNT